MLSLLGKIYVDLQEIKSNQNIIFVKLNLNNLEDISVNFPEKYSLEIPFKTMREFKNHFSSSFEKRKYECP